MTRTLPIGDLSTCDREPIHIPGSIQARGVVLACRQDGWIITHATANADAVFNEPAKGLIGRDASALLGPALTRALHVSNVGGPSDCVIPNRLFGVKIGGRKGAYNIASHSHDGRRIIEIEPAGTAAVGAPLDLVRVMLAHLQQARTLHDLCDATVEQLRQLIGYDRVMIYRFLHDDSGQVIAEAKSSDIEPLLNLRYPASDIPSQARELYKRNWVRLIDDVASLTVPIVAAADEQQRPLDLSYADLRSVSPIHIEYLKNMGVAASMSISIIVGGQLWGLIACHHRRSRVVPANLRAAAELIGQVFSLQIQTVEGIEAYVTMRAARALLDRVVAEFPVQGDLVNNLSARLDQLAAFIPCDGVGLWMDGVWKGSGVTPSVTEVKALARAIQGQREAGIFATHDLATTFDAASVWKCGIRGLLAVPLSRTSGNWLLFFRREVSQAVEWAGNPDKAVTGDMASGRLSPRKSFEAWKVEVRGQSLPWTSRERLIGDTLRIYLLDIIVRFSEVIMEERRQAEQRQRLATNELNHRVRGTLELIQSLIVEGYSDHERVQSFVRTLEGRLKAIALAHDTISVSPVADVRGLIEGAVSVQSAHHARVVIDGPDIKVDAKAYNAMALVVHELVTISATSGALSIGSGTLTVEWFLDPMGRLVLVWDEEGGRTGSKPASDGLGQIIIRRNIPHALGGEADLRFEPSGVKASFIIPARYLAAPAKLASEAPEPRLHIAPPDHPLEGFSILILEDQMATALELERLLRERGAAVVTVLGTPLQALELIAADPPDVAVLDIDLGDTSSIEVANELARQSIPFIFAGNEADARLIPPHHREVSIASKPYSADALADMLKEALLPHLIRAVLGRLV